MRFVKLYETDSGRVVKGQGIIDGSGPDYENQVQKIVSTGLMEFKMI